MSNSTMGQNHKLVALPDLSSFWWVLRVQESKIAIDGWKSKKSSMTEYVHLLNEAKEIANQLELVEFKYVQRQTNKSACNITRHARHVSEFSVWMEDIPPHLVSVIQVDLAYHQ